MHKPVIVIHTIGNRDLQFPGDSGLPIDFQRDYLEKNPEPQTESFYMLRKGKSPAPFETFVKIAREVLRRYQEPQQGPLFEKAIRFPILMNILRYVLTQHNTIDQLVLLATMKSEEHRYDTHPVANLAKLHLPTLGLPILEIKPVFLSVSPTPEGRKDLVDEVTQKSSPFLQANSQIFISNHQGLPDVSRALDILGYFKGYTYLASHAQKGVSVIDHSPYEYMLANLVKQNLVEALHRIDPLTMMAQLPK